VDRLDGKVVVVTGASRGIDADRARLFAAEATTWSARPARPPARSASPSRPGSSRGPHQLALQDLLGLPSRVPDAARPAGSRPPPDRPPAPAARGL